MKKFCSNLFSKNTIQTWGGVLGILLCLTACKNFLDAGKIKDEITAMIDYNNAPAYTILVEADRASGTLLKPITGEVKKKATDVFPVKFEPNEGYKFQKWEATCTDPLSENDSISNYIVFEDETSLETNVTFKKGLKNIVIRPVCPAIPDAQIKIDGDNGNFSPSKGVYTKKAGSITSVIFDAQTDYEFIRWQILDETTGNEIQNGTYLLLENPTESRTTFEVVDTPDPDSGINLLLQPVTAERPQVLSWGPDTENERATKDATIQVVFDRAMDENSIYYTDDEFGKIGTTNIQWWYSEKNGKPYAYKNLTEANPIKVYKNIVIRYDDDQESNINSCFGEPVFTTSKSITLPVDRTLSEDDLPKNWSSILVSFEKGFFYSVKISKDSETTKPVKMAKPKKWIYDVTDKTDKVAPVLKTNTVKTSKTDGTALSGETLTITDKLSYTNISTYATNSTIVYTNKMYVKFELEDTNGMPKSFEIYYRKAFDEYYQSNNVEWASKPILYHSTGKKVSYENEIDFTKEEYGFDDGLYQVYFKFTDASGNPRYYPESDAPDAENPQPPTKFFNICIDTGIHISMPSQTPTRYEEQIVLKLADSNQTLPGDLKTITVYNGTTQLKQFNNTVTPVNIADLYSVTIPLKSLETYNIKVVYVDYKNQASTKQFSYTTLKPTITPKSLDFSNGNLFSMFDLVDFSSIPDETTTTFNVTVEELNSNMNYIPINPDANGKYYIKQGNVYHIEIEARKGSSTVNRVSIEYKIFTQPKPLNLRFTPDFVENPKGNSCMVNYSIVRADDECCHYIVNDKLYPPSSNPVIKGYADLLLSGDETMSLLPLTVKCKPLQTCDIDDSITFTTKIPIIPYGTCFRMSRNNSSGKLTKALIIETEEFATNTITDRTINIIYNGIQIGSGTLTGNEGVIPPSSPLEISIESANIIPSTSPLVGTSFIIESIDNTSNQYIARQEYIYSAPSSPVINLQYQKGLESLTVDYTLTWINPNDDEYCGLQVEAEYKTSSTSDKKIIGPIDIDKNSTQYTFTGLPGRISSITFKVSTTNFAGDLTTERKGSSAF